MVLVTKASNITKVGTTSASFLEIGAGAKAIGMGSAFVAIANDASALYWNVAGIARIEKNQLIFSYNKWFADIKYNYFGGIFPAGNMGTFGAFITYLSTDDMAVRTIEYPEGTGEKFNATDFAMGLSYAINLTDRFSIGFTTKYVSEKIWHMKSHAIAFDIGTLFQTQFKTLKIGMSITNFGNKMQMSGKDAAITYDIDPNKYGNNDRIMGHLDSDKFQMPLNFRLGISFDVFDAQVGKMTMGIDALHPNNNSEYMAIGTEYSYNDFLFLRAGYNSLFLKNSEEGPSVGFGINYQLYPGIKFILDYAWTKYNDLGNINRISMILAF